METRRAQWQEYEDGLTEKRSITSRLLLTLQPKYCDTPTGFVQMRRIREVCWHVNTEALAQLLLNAEVVKKVLLTRPPALTARSLTDWRPQETRTCGRCWTRFVANAAG